MNIWRLHKKKRCFSVWIKKQQNIGSWKIILVCLFGSSAQWFASMQSIMPCVTSFGVLFIMMPVKTSDYSASIHGNMVNPLGLAISGITLLFEHLPSQASEILRFLVTCETINSPDDFSWNLICYCFFSVSNVLCI